MISARQELRNTKSILAMLPLYVKRLPLAQQEEAFKAVEQMHAMGTIQPSACPWASLVVLVKKKDSSRRFCVD